MATITFITNDETVHELEVPDGLSLMQAAVNNGVPGIDADCGGAAACGTCHVHVDMLWLAATGERTELEVAMLECADGVKENSRLSCQIKVSSALNGLVVRIPQNQH